MELPDRLPDNVRAIVEACIAHARGLVETAEAALERGRAHIAYALAALALEETGKAGLVEVDFLAGLREEDTPSTLSPITTDHVRKVWWALWAEQFGREKIDQQQIDELNRFARYIEERRQDSLYVDPRLEQFVAPCDRMDVEEATSLVKLARYKVEIHSAQRFVDVPADRKALVMWFARASEAPETRGLLLGGPSMAKLAELGDVRAWMQWLKDQIEEGQATGRRMLEQELRRVPVPGDGRHKWLVRARIFSPSHKFTRKAALNRWNDSATWIKLRSVSGKKDALDLEFYLPRAIPLAQLNDTALKIALRFVAAMNIGTLGYFWWYIPQHIASYFEKVTDLESKTEVVINLSPRLSVNWGGGKKAFDEKDTGSTAASFAALTAMDSESEAIKLYLQGIAILAKIDVHFRVEQNAFITFFDCLRAAMSELGGVSAEGFADIFRAFVAEVVPGWDVERFLEMEAKARAAQVRLSEITLEHVAMMKVMCDAYLSSELRKRLPKRTTRDAGGEGEADLG